MDKAAKWTDKKLAAMEKRLTGIYSRAQSEVGQKWQAYLKRIDEQSKPLLKAIEDAKSPEERDEAEKAYKLLIERKTVRDAHFRALTEQYAKNLNEVSKVAQAYVNDQLPQIYSVNYNEIGKGIASQVKGYSFEAVNQDVVKRLATENKTLLPYKKVDEEKHIRWNTKKVNAEVTQGILQGESVPDIAKRLRNVTEMDLASSIRNARTTTTSAQNKGRIDSFHAAEEKGVILKKVWLATNDSRTREEHLELDGQERDIDEPFENSLGPIMYPGDINADPANVYNCFVGETNIATDSEVIRSYKHNYSGRFVTVKTAGGVNFTCTPNHPILTIGGWVPAESLQKGNDILVAFRRNDVFGRINPNINHVFPRIDAIHKLFNMLGGDRTVSMSVNFHGDISTSDVEIITKKRLLREGRNSGVFNSINKFLLKHSDKSFLRLRSFSKHFGRIWSSALGFVGGVSKSLPFFFTGLRHPEIHRLRPIALLYSGRVKPLDNDVARNAELISECLDGFSGFVFADNIVSVDFSSGCSHVYNLQTENGYYFVNSSIAQSKRKSNGIFAIAHNCRCTMITKVMGFKRFTEVE